jgi:hypothetical protein
MMELRPLLKGVTSMVLSHFIQQYLKNFTVVYAKITSYILLTSIITFALGGCITTQTNPSPADIYEQVIKLGKKDQPIGPLLDYLKKTGTPYTVEKESHKVVLVIHDTDRRMFSTESIAVEIEYNKQEIITLIACKKLYTGP